MTESSEEPLSADLIARYLLIRGKRYFRGQHDGEFFFVLNTDQRRLHVHIEIPPRNRDVVAIRVIPACYFPAADRLRLEQFADVWNQENREITATVCRSSDPLRIGFAASKSRWMGNRVCFDDFATFVDRAVAAAIILFAALAPLTEVPLAPLLRDAG